MHIMHIEIVMGSCDKSYVVWKVQFVNGLTSFFHETLQLNPKAIVELYPILEPLV